MAINHATDTAAILALITASRSGSGLTDAQWSDQMATIIETIALSMTVTVTSVSGVTTGGGTSGPGTGSLS